MMDLAGLLAAAALLVTLVALEVRRARAGTGQNTGGKRPGPMVGRLVVAGMWAMYLILFLPRVLGLLA